MRAKLIALPIGIGVVALIGAAMFHNRAAANITAKPSTIEPGQAAPHEDRGLCTACHLLGGPAVKPTFGTTAGNPLQMPGPAAPAIRIDEIRPHAERGSCVNCHTILPATQVTAAGDQLAQMNGAFATAMAPGFYPMNGNGFATQVAPGNPAMGRGRGGPPQAMLPATQLPGNRGTGVAPPIAAGTTAPHGWRGDCVSCHSVLQATGWSPTPALAGKNGARPFAGPRETEALGMSVRPTNGDVEGMMVVDIEGQAKRAGLKLGDIVRAVDGMMISDVPGFKDAMRATNLRRGVVVDVVRDGQAQALVIK